MLRGIGGLLSGGTLTEAYYESAEMRERLAVWNERIGFDAVLAFSSSMAGYALPIDAGRRVIDFCDLDSLKWQAYARQGTGPLRVLYAVEGRRMATRERAWSSAFDRTIVITREEAQSLIDAVGAARALVAGNGVTLPDEPLIGQLPSESVVGFVGAMDYKPNVEGVCWFCKEVWPRIKTHRPEAVFRIVGRAPARRVRRLAKYDGVEVVGAVEDVGPWIRGFRVSIAPLHIARGLQNKVLEAMAWARPVVLTSAAACGIEGVDGREYVVADSAESFSRAVLNLLADEERAVEMGRSARQRVAWRHDWAREMGKIERALIGPVTEIDPPMSARNVLMEVGL